ncbi:MAG TPA: sulfatase-like hydrolase/transferase [Pelobium sp.]|nr:sulfatase-like hydrolase/transferase [Pelobium sp.]
MTTFKKRSFLLYFSLFALATSTAFGQSQKKPNIILIMADDLGYETIGCNGNDDKLTPNIDKLAESGMLFENCHSMPLCTPSRVQLMTGKYNNRNYIGFGLLDPSQETFAHALQKQGYKTCIAGKWQLYGNEKQFKLAGGLKGTVPQNAGFDNFLVWQVDELGSRYQDPTVYTDEKKSMTLKGKYGDEEFTSYIEKFIENNKDTSFMVYYPMCLTHDPFVPTPFSKDYKDFPSSSEKSNPNYYKDMLSYHDYLVGRIVKKVDELGLRDNTIIIYTGDNGTSPQIISNFRGGKVQGNKGKTNYRGTHVPLVVNWKNNIKAGSINKSLIDFTDFFPTILNLAGTTSKVEDKLDGKSFYPQLKGNTNDQRNWIYTYYDPKWGKYTRKVFAQTLDWKLYETGEIFDLNNDREELKPIAKNLIKGKDLATINMLQKAIIEKTQKQ